MNTGPRDWDAETYHRVSDMQLGWGMEVLERLPLNGDETVLDAGCGTGRLTAVLAERLPDGRVIAVDGSDAMVAKARETLGGGVEVFQADLAELELLEPVDAVFSNAVFHWIMNHDALFSRMFAALRPGGRMVVQCGGHGNVASLARVIAAVGADPRFASSLEGIEPMWNFATPEETKPCLEAAGFVDVRCWLEPKPVIRDDAFDALRACALGPILDQLPEGDRDEFTRRVAERMGTPLKLDYVRLNIDARRAP